MRKAEEWNVFFEDNHRYADLINGIGCDGVQFVKDTDLTEVDPTAGTKSRDILRKVAFGVNFAIVGVEHQENNDYEIPLRTLCYDASRYEKQAAQIKKIVRAKSKGLEPGEYMYGFKKDSKLNPIVTFVLYAGEQEWDGPYSLHDMIDFADIPDKLQEMVSDYKINLINIRELENTDVFKTDVKQVFDFIRCSNDRNKLLELVENNAYYKEMEDDALDVVAQYTRSKELVRAREYKTKGGKNDVCKAIRDLMDDSREEGIEEGIEKTLTTAVKKKLEKNKSFEQMADELEIDISEVEKYVRLIQSAPALAE